MRIRRVGSAVTVMMVAALSVACGTVNNSGGTPTPTGTVTPTPTPTLVPPGWVMIQGTGSLTMSKGDGSSSWALPYGSSIYPSLDPTRFFFAPHGSPGEGELYVSTLDGTSKQQLRASTDVMRLTQADATHAVVEFRTPAFDDNLEVVDIGTGATTPLAVDGSNDEMLAISGGRVAYERVTGTTVQYRSVKLDGTGDMTLLAATSFGKFLGVTAAGRAVMQFDPPSGSLSQVRSMLLDGTGVVDFAPTGVNANASCLVDDRVIYTLGSGVLYSVQAANADGTSVVPLSSAGHNDNPMTTGDHHCFVGAGRLLFTRADTGHLFSAPLAGGGETDLGPSPALFNGIWDTTVIGNDANDDTGTLFAIDTTTGVKTTMSTAAGGKYVDFVVSGTLYFRLASDGRAYFTSVAGGTVPVLLTPDASAGSDEFGPGGVAHTDAAGNGTLYTFDPSAPANGVNVAATVTGVSLLTPKRTTPDGRILFGSLNGRDLRIVDHDGQNLITLPVGVPIAFFPGN